MFSIVIPSGDLEVITLRSRERIALERARNIKMLDMARMVAQFR